MQISSIDPLIKTLLGCANQDEVTRSLANMYKRLDVDQSGGLSFQELRDGLRKMNFDPPIILTQDEFDTMTENKSLCDDEEEVDVEAFETIMRLEMIKFCNRQLSVSVPGECTNDSIWCRLYKTPHFCVRLCFGLILRRECVQPCLRTTSTWAFCFLPSNSCWTSAVGPLATQEMMFPLSAGLVARFHLQEPGFLDQLQKTSWRMEYRADPFQDHPQGRRCAGHYGVLVQGKIPTCRRVRRLKGWKMATLQPS